MRIGIGRFLPKENGSRHWDSRHWDWVAEKGEKSQKSKMAESRDFSTTNYNQRALRASSFM